MTAMVMMSQDGGRGSVIHNYIISKNSENYENRYIWRFV